MKIGFTGSKAGITELQLLRLVEIIRSRKPKSFHQGDCIGGDAQAWFVVRSNFTAIQTVSHPPLSNSMRAQTKCDEEREPKSYLQRNHEIVNETDLLIACPREPREVNRSGTWATVRYARRVKKPIIIIYPDGSIVEHRYGVEK